MNVQALADYMLYQMRTQESIDGQVSLLGSQDGQSNNLADLLPSANFTVLLEQWLGQSSGTRGASNLFENQTMQGPAADPAYFASIENQLGANSAPLIGTSTNIPNDVNALIDHASARYNVDPALIASVIQQESGFNSKAVSAVGAQGLMQLMPATAESLGVSDAFDPQANIDGGTKYLRNLLERFHGDTGLALAAYNAGPGTLLRLGIQTGQDLASKFSSLPTETQHYVQEVEANANRSAPS